MKIKSGLNKIYPDQQDFSLVRSYGATLVDPKGLLADFSIYDGRTIPNQMEWDTRFNPPVRPLFFGCTAESQTFTGGLEDGALYPPDDLYDNTFPYRDGEGRDMRKSLQATIDRGYKLPDGTLGNKRTAYFNCEGSGKIDDFDAVRIAIWINQFERRPVSVGSFWYPDFMHPMQSTWPGSLLVPSFNMRDGSLHNYIVTGWRTVGTREELEVIPWLGMEWGVKGKGYMSREIYNGLMRQPYTAAYTLAKTTNKTPIPVGAQVYIDHLLYFIRNLFNV